jgi:hypothetical protein
MLKQLMEELRRLYFFIFIINYKKISRMTLVDII